jgi:hypothetical protein
MSELKKLSPPTIKREAEATSAPLPTGLGRGPCSLCRETGRVHARTKATNTVFVFKCICVRGQWLRQRLPPWAQADKSIFEVLP